MLSDRAECQKRPKTTTAVKFERLGAYCKCAFGNWIPVLTSNIVRGQAEFQLLFVNKLWIRVRNYQSQILTRIVYYFGNILGGFAQAHTR